MLCSSFLSWSQLGKLPTIDTLNSYLYKSKFVEAQSLAFERLKQKNVSDSERAQIYMILSDVERLTTSPKLGIDKAFKAIRILEKSSEPNAKGSIPFAYHKVANIYFERRLLDSALAYAIKSNDLARNIPVIQAGIDKIKMVNAPILTEYYIREKKYSLVRETILEAEVLLKRYGSNCELTQNQLKFSQLELGLGNLPKAISYAEKALAIADSCKTYTYQHQALTHLIELSIINNDAKLVHEYHERQNALHAAIRIDQQQDDIRLFELRNKEQSQKLKNIALQEENKLQRNLNLLYISILVLALSAVIVLLNLKRKLKRNIRKLDEQQKETERINQLNSRIFNIISSDFKAPLSNLQMGLDLLHTNELAPEDFKKISNNVRKQMTQTQLMMENLLSWAQSELSEQSSEYHSSNPSQIVQLIGTELEALIEQKNLKFVNSIPSELMLNIHPETLKIIYRNLINNAIKYSYDFGKITVGYIESSEILFVGDEGIGLDESVLKQLFNSKQNATATTENENGYSLGLQMIEELVQQAGGKIWAETNIPKGLITKIKLPVSQQYNV